MNTYFFFRYEFEADVNNMIKKLKYTTSLKSCYSRQSLFSC